MQRKKFLINEFRKCPICGKEFLVNSLSLREKVYCSYECRKEGIRLRYHERMSSRQVTEQDKQALHNMEVALAAVRSRNINMVSDTYGLSPDKRALFEQKYGKIVLSKFIDNNLVCIFKEGENNFFWKSFIGEKKMLESVKNFSTFDDVQEDVIKCFR
jgi:uncharacterized protein with PIN domain